MNRKRMLAVAAMTVGGALAMAVPAGAAVQLQSESPAAGAVNLRNTATLGARGAVVTARTVVVCPAGATASLYVELSQRVGNGIAAGSGYEPVSCTGYRQTVRVDVPATAGGKPFKRGVAYGAAQLAFFHPAYGFTEVRDDGNVTIQ